MKDWRGQPERACVRCGADVVGVAPGEHICKDVLDRARQARDREFAEYARELIVLGGEG